METFWKTYRNLNQKMISCQSVNECKGISRLRRMKPYTISLTVTYHTSNEKRILFFRRENFARSSKIISKIP